ncbi:GSCFA domain-containing protein [Pseudomonas sp. CFBP 13727]|uniref:GSCFA domain-containing protein n=1 Tax=Pseudomonas sp. CFBP 13727 TaxID=2775295 RepID=UPI00177E95B5|nr:GSCFA domain-containing protein [Pseudomonas sp. CFBP 13727]MBD8621591.1 GSCFA domain-containing protein [Pseudomonas sp. CFBP 13727]
MAISHEEINNAYRYLLGRQPESDSAYAAYQPVNSVNELYRIIIDSTEYQAKKDNLKRIFIIGNCQSEVLANLLESMVPELAAVSCLVTAKKLEEICVPNALSNQFTEADLILIQSSPNDPIPSRILSIYGEYKSKIRLIPNIYYALYHPDIIYVQNDSGNIKGPMGEYHSGLILFAWKQSLSLGQTADLFTRDVYAHVGYFEHATSSANLLLETGINVGIPLDHLLERWRFKACFMHSMNHPKLNVLADIARAVLIREGMSYIPGVEQYMEDSLALHPCWPVYPDIAAVYGIEGSYFFKQVTDRSSSKPKMIDLNELIAQSFEIYDKYEKSSLNSSVLETSFFKSLPAFLKTRNINHKHQSLNPYLNLHKMQYWRRSMEKISISDVDPVIGSRFTIDKHSRVATAGSCFAQHISRTLSANGFNYYVTETGSHLSAEESLQRNFGVFSARYANIYTSSQLLQLFEEAFGIFKPTESYWTRPDGKYVDPYRPQIEPQGFSSIQDLISSRKEHLDLVRTMFEQLDVFVFTLGLTETWRSKIDHSVFPIAPGVAGGRYDISKYEFLNIETSDVINDLEKFIIHLSAVNPNAKIILTVSPVPLVATYENRHVLTSNTYSKSALRSAADAIVRRHQHCDYFPSYEIITGNYSRSQFYADDLRSVTEAGVSKVMGLFMKYYACSNQSPVDEAADARSQEIYKQSLIQSAVICEEELLDKPAQEH